MPIVFLMIGLVLGSLVYTSLSEKAKEKHADVACSYYLQQMKLENVPLQQGDTLKVPDSIFEYSREYMPLLHSKWEQIRSDYATTSASIKTMELRYQKLVELNKLSSSPISTDKPKTYQTWLKLQNESLEKSRLAHEQILKAIEKYYADAQIRGVDSEAELQEIVGGLVKTANMVLGDYKYEAALIPETVITEQGTKQDAAKTIAHEQGKKSVSSSPDNDNSKETGSKSEKQKDKSVKEHSSSKITAKATEIQAYMKFAKSYADKISLAAELMDSICSASSGRAADKELSALSTELIRLQEQCRSFRFKHVKNFETEVENPNIAIFSKIEEKSGQIKNRLQLLRYTRGWVSSSTLSNFSKLIHQ